jgi:cystathionine gamma-synthase
MHADVVVVFHPSQPQLAAIANEKLANNTATDKCYLFPTLKVACSCISFLESRHDPAVHQEPYYKRFTVSNPEDSRDSVTLYAVFMHQDDFGLGKQFWQHAGDGISSRLAYHCLHLLGESIPGAPSSTPAPHLANGNTNSNGTSYRSTPPPPIRGFSRNKHYSKKSSAAMEAILASSSSSHPYASTSAHAGASSSSEYHNANGSSVDPAETSAQYATGEDTSTYIEERYARNLTESQAPLAKIALRRRIAGVLKESTASSPSTSPSNSPSTPHSSLEDQQLDPTLSQALQEASFADAALQPSSRGVKGLTEDDVYLYPGGMSAIFHAFMTVLATEQNKDKAKGKQQEEAQDHIGKSICFGFPYTDTLKILQKWGPGCEFFGRGLDSDLEELEALLQERQRRYKSNPNSKDPNDKPILSLFAEFPSNPLLRSPDLERLKQLADQYGFYIVIDETVGGFVNVETLPYADIVVSSLTKIFSGDSNVMGGS